MRTEEDMMALILDVARKDEQIRAVYMNGSRTNPNVPKDIFQDYDIVYVVKEVTSFMQQTGWIDVFGDRIMMQEPDKNDLESGRALDIQQSYMYLMLFTDGNRIDLKIETKEAMLERYGSDLLTIPLLDKDGCLPSIAAPTDRDYQVKKPSEPLYASCCNDFWWCLQNVAKGIWRDELPYAKQMFEGVIRPRLDEMVSWWVGSEQNYSVSIGKMGKYMKTYLPESYWRMYEQTYSDSNYEKMWVSVFAACALFRLLANEVAKDLSYTYHEADDIQMTKYLEHVRYLPRDAKEIH